MIDLGEQDIESPVVGRGQWVARSYQSGQVAVKRIHLGRERTARFVHVHLHLRPARLRDKLNNLYNYNSVKLTVLTVIA